VPIAEITSRSPEQTADFAAALAAELRPGDLVLLIGELGAGKTTLIRSLATALGVEARTVSSPTFVLANEYAGARGLRLVHIDAYRLVGDDEEELQLLGWDRLGGDDTIVLIEWADRIAHLIDRPALRLTLEHAGEDQRHITLEVPPTWADRSFPGLKRGAKTTPCPVTGEPVSPDSPHYPFSSERAQWADLYRWFSESHQINRPLEQADLEQEQ